MSISYALNHLKIRSCRSESFLNENRTNVRSKECIIFVRSFYLVMVSSLCCCVNVFVPFLVGVGGGLIRVNSCVVV